MVSDLFHPAVRRWFSEEMGRPSRIQEIGWPVIAGGNNCLLLSPTGSGKTLAAFLWAINRLMFAPAPAKQQRCRVLYISPLKALAVDVERNLRAPLAGIATHDEHWNLPSIAVRTGDTPSRERAQFNRNPADILITTPESFYLMLTSNARETLRSIEVVIVDEIHSVVGTKRGVHLAVSLERLRAITTGDFQRIGLSATQRPLEEIAEFLGGGEIDSVLSAEWQSRPVTIVDAGALKDLDLQVVTADEEGTEDDSASRYGAMPLLYARILNLIRTHNSTLIFANSRRLAERMAAALNELAGANLVKAHHGSVAREQRSQIEEELKAGVLSGLVATSTLELGIDMGAIDLVIQVEAPNSIAIGLQRIGRAGHRQAARSKGVLLPKFRGDLLACAAASRLMMQGSVEEMHYIRNPLDVLAQQVVAMVAMDEWTVDDLERLMRRAAPFAHLTRSMLEGVLDMLTGKFPSADFSDLKPRITWDRITGKLRPREGARRIAVVNGGTIPDRGLFGVFLAGAETGKGRVGELDEEMVFETRPGETFFLGASTWRVEQIKHDRVIVSPAPGEQGKMPFWHGESNGRSLEFGLAIGKLIRELNSVEPSEARRMLISDHQLTEIGARNLLAYIQEQKENGGAIPDDETIVIENHTDDFGDLRVCILSTLGGRIHAPWTHAVQALVKDKLHLDVETLWSDDGMIIRFPELEEPPRLELLIPDPEEVEDLVLRQIGGSPLFASRFREAAGRALLLPRRYPGQRTPLWHQRRRAADLLQVAAKFDSFPIILETYRELLRDSFDIPALIKVLEGIRSRKIRTVSIHTKRPSPFAASLMFGYVGNFIYEGDAPLAERRAQALAVDQSQLRELLGEAELRELLDPEIIRQWERQLQALDPEYQAKNSDSLHDLFLRLGDLTDEDVEARCNGLGLDWLSQLRLEKRIASVKVAGEQRWIAVEDAARYRDALGCVIASDLPAALMLPTQEPLLFILHRYARTHGPFVPDHIVMRYRVSPAEIMPVLSHLEKQGKLARGEFHRGGSGQEWCDSGVLRVIRQRSLARLRQEIEPVEENAYGRFLPDWHRVGGRLEGMDGLLDVISQLQGYPLPASVLETQILTARLARYDSHELDSLLASGQVVWIGVESLGQFDGRIAFYLAEDASKLLIGNSDFTGITELKQTILNFLQKSGASFFPQIFEGVKGGFKQEVIQALWDLVWAGKIMNDSFLPLRAYLQLKASNRKKKSVKTLIPPEVSGRWSLTTALQSNHSATEKLHAFARQLLLRYGIVTREALPLEQLTGGFSAIYPTLKVMEEAGRIRRGYFISGRGAAQFGEAGAIERMRNVREPGAEPVIRILAATDPANPYGASLPWPERPERQQAGRFAGARVILVDGRLVAYFGKGERSLLTFFTPDDPHAHLLAYGVAKALGSLVDSGFKRAVLLSEIDGAPAQESFLSPALKTEGFQAYAHGLQRRRRELTLEK